MKNFAGNSQIVTIIAPCDMKGGVPLAIGGFIAVPQNDALKDELTAVVTEGIVLLKVTGTAIIGDSLFFHSKDNTISKTQADGICCGFALESASDSEIKVMLNKTISTGTSVDLSAYFKSADFNQKFKEALALPEFTTAVQAAVKPASK